MSELAENAITLHDNTKAHSADTVENVFWYWGWEILEYPSYSPNLNPRNCDLIHKLKQPLRGKWFAHIEDKRWQRYCPGFLPSPSLALNHSQPLGLLWRLRVCMNTLCCTFCSIFSLYATTENEIFHKTFTCLIPVAPVYTHIWW
jgi:hypothetical protein